MLFGIVPGGYGTRGTAETLTGLPLFLSYAHMTSSRITRVLTGGPNDGGTMSSTSFLPGTRSYRGSSNSSVLGRGSSPAIFRVSKSSEVCVTKTWLVIFVVPVVRAVFVDFTCLVNGGVDTPSHGPWRLD